MPLPRVRLRTLMIAVAVVGVTIAAGREAIRLWRVSTLHRNRATEHAQSETIYRGLAVDSAKRAKGVRVDAETLPYYRLPEGYRSLADPEDQLARSHEEWAARLARIAEYHAALRRRHERAARRPWLPVPPDPPPR